jgi:hypothetical protein
MPTATHVPRVTDTTKVFQGKAAVEAYMKNMKVLYSDLTYSIEDCPSCRRVSCKICQGGVAHWVDTVKRAAPTEVFFAKQTMACVSWCTTYDNVKYARQVWHTDDQLGKWSDGEAKTSKKPLCTCDYDTVIRFKGCQCGGR